MRGPHCGHFKNSEGDKFLVLFNIFFIHPAASSIQTFWHLGEKSRMDFVCHLGDTLTSAPFGPFVDNVQSFVVFVVVYGLPKDVQRTTTNPWAGKSDHFL